jgi:hypothetical protein
MYCPNARKRCLILLVFSFIPILHHTPDVSLPITLKKRVQIPVLAPSQGFPIAHQAQVGGPQSLAVSRDLVAKGERSQA